jgi:heterodisulfide reductase subunit B
MHVPRWAASSLGGCFYVEKQPSYTLTEAKRAYEQLDQLVAKKAVNPRQASAYRPHIASRVQVTLKPSYTAQAARRAKVEIARLTEGGTLTVKSAAA